MLRQHTYNEIKGVSTEEKEASVSNNRFRDFFSTPSFFLFDRQRVVCDTEKPMGEGNDRIWAVVTGLRVHRNNLGPICISIGHPIISLSRKKKKNRKKGEKKKIKIPPPASSGPFRLLARVVFLWLRDIAFNDLIFFFFFLRCKGEIC